MWIAFAILTTAAVLMSAVLALHKWENRRFVRATLANRAGRSSPLRTMLIVPCRGTDVDLEENLRALFRQRCVEYRLRFVVEDLGDAAALPIVALQREFPAVPSELVCAGRALESGQKVHNLLAATSEVPDEVEALAFADSDTCPHPYWLAALLTRLADPTVGARTGYRWLIPQRLTWPNLLLHSINSSVASMFSRHRYNTVWGGAWAIRREVFERTGIREAWFGTLNDDLVATRVLHGTPLRIEFEPLCMTASPVDMTPAQTINFLRRQFIQVRRYVPHYWWLALVAGSLFQAAIWSSAALSIACLIQGEVWWWPAGVWIALYGLAVFRGWLGQSAFRPHLAPHDAQLALPRQCDIWLGPLIGVFGWLAILESAIGSSITWRGIRYWISPGGRILNLGRTLGESDLIAIRRGAVPGQPQPALRLHEPDEPADRETHERRKAA
jgi:hypothetical protein